MSSLKIGCSILALRCEGWMTWLMKALRTQSAHSLPFPSLFSDYGYAHLLFLSLMKPPQCPFLSVALSGFQDISSSSSSSCCQFAFTFSALLPPTSLFLPLWKLSLTVCLRCPLLFGHMWPAPLFHFSFPSEPETAQREQGLLASCCLWGQATITYYFGASVFFVHWEDLFRDQGWQTVGLHLAHSQWFSFRVLRLLKENVVGKAWMLWLVLGWASCLSFLTPAAACAYFLPVPVAVEF